MNHTEKERVCLVCSAAPVFAKEFCRHCYYQRPEIKARQRAYQQRPEYKARQRAYKQRPEIKAKLRAYQQRPEIKAKLRAYQQRPEIKAKLRAYKQRPEYKARQRAYQQRKKFSRAPIAELANDFFITFNHNKAWKKKGIEEMAHLFADTACNITAREKCALEEKILIKASKVETEKEQTK